MMRLFEHSLKIRTRILLLALAATTLMDYLDADDHASFGGKA